MKVKILIGGVAVLALITGAVLPAGAGGKPKPVMVFEDPSGDAGNDGTGPLPGFTEAGFDLIKGEIAKEGKDKIKFVVTHQAMPSSGTPGEGFRLIWGLAVDGTQYEMTIKSLDIGKPDVIASVMGQDPNGEERVGQVYQGVARLEECGTISLGINWSQCTAIGYYDAVFDPATATVTWIVDMKTMKAKKGSMIAGGGGGRAGTGCMICWVPQYLERSLTPTTIIDAATQTVPYTIP